MVVVFWFCFALLVWCYAGFPLSLRALAQLRPRPWRGRLDRQPPVSIVVAVRNGAGQLRRRLDDLFRGSYPPDCLEVLVVCNGCTDGTEEIARDYSVRDPRVRVLESPAELGKSGALSLGVAAARGEFVVLADVRQTFHREAISRLLEPFGDPEVGAVSGRLVLARGLVRGEACDGEGGGAGRRRRGPETVEGLRRIHAGPVVPDPDVDEVVPGGRRRPGEGVPRPPIAPRLHAPPFQTHHLYW